MKKISVLKKYVVLLTALLCAVFAFAVASVVHKNAFAAVSDSSPDRLVDYGNGVFYMEDNNFDLYSEQAITEQDGKIELSFALDIVDSPYWQGSNDAWINLALSDTSGAKRPDSQPYGNLCALLRLTARPSKGQTINVNEIFVNGALLSVAVPFPFETGVIRVSYVIDAEETSLTVNGARILTTYSYSLTDFKNGAYWSIRGYTAGSARWLLYGSENGISYVGDGSLDKRGANTWAQFAVRDFENGISSVSDGKGNALPYEYNAARRTLFVDMASYMDTLQSGDTIVVRDGAGKSYTPAITVTDTSAIEIEQDDYTFYKPSEEALLVRFESAGITDLRALWDGNTQTGVSLKEGAVELSAAFLSSLDYGNYSLEIRGTRGDGTAIADAATITVADSRMPAVAEMLYVGSNAQEQFARATLSFVKYDATVTGVLVGDLTITDYEVTQEGIAFGENAFSDEEIGYGPSQAVVITSKGNVPFTLYKYSEKGAEIPDLGAVDKADVIGMTDLHVPARLYGDSVERITLGGVEITEFTYTAEQIVIEAGELESVALGEVTLAVTLKKHGAAQPYEVTASVELSDTRIPALVALRNYDLAYPDQCAVAVFCVYNYPSFSLEAADGSVLTSETALAYHAQVRVELSKEWFANKNLGDMRDFTARYGSSAQSGSFPCSVSVVTTAIENGTFSKEDDEAAYFLAFSPNGGRILGVQVDGATCNYSYADGVLSLPFSVFDEKSGNANVVVSFESCGDFFQSAFVLNVRENRNPKLAQTAFETDKKLPAEIEIAFTRYKHIATGVYASTGLLQEECTLSENGVTFGRDYLASLPVGISTFWLCFDHKTYLPFTVTVTDTRAPVLLATRGSADLKALSDVVLPYTAYVSSVTNVTVNGNELVRAYYKVSAATLTIRSGYLGTLPAGTYVFVFETDRGNMEYTLSLVDTRVQVLSENNVEHRAADGVLTFKILSYANRDYTFRLDGKDITKHCTVEDGVVTIDAAAFAKAKQGSLLLEVISQNGTAQLRIQFIPQEQNLTALWYVLSVVGGLLVAGGAMLAAWLVCKKRKTNKE